jgi:STE24 endopeptidase
MVIIGGPLIWLILWIMETAGPLWWLYVWMVWFGFSLFMMWAYPAFIAPLFNKFEPLEDGDLKQRIEKLLQQCGFTSKGIFIMDGSKRSSHGNAYFSGLGNNKRIVFFDTLINNLEPDEIEAVLAHELGHFRLKHIRKRLIGLGIISLAGLALLGWLMQQNWFFSGLGLDMPSNYMALLLFMLLQSVFGFFLTPIMSYWSRRHEFEADSYAARQRDARMLITALVKMYEENASTLTPDPVYSGFYDSHPPAPVRINHLQASAQPAA